MNTSALLLMLSAYLVVTAFTGYFFIRVFRKEKE